MQIRSALGALLFVLLLLLQGAILYKLSRFEARWDPFDQGIEAHVMTPPVCLQTIWCSTGEESGFPCTKITVTTCQMEGESPQALKARHQAAVNAQMSVWPEDCECED